MKTVVFETFREMATCKSPQTLQKAASCRLKVISFPLPLNVILVHDFFAGTFEFDFTTTKMPSSDAKPLAMNLLQRVMSNLIVALRPSVNMHIKEILQMLRRYNYSSLQVT